MANRNPRGKRRKPERKIIKGGSYESVARGVDEAVEENQKQRKEKVRKMRQEISRKSQMANKRIRRLEEKGVMTPALRSFYDSRGKGNYFSIRGKSNNQAMQELAEIEKYLDMATSTLTGAREILNDTARKFNIELTGKDWVENQKKVNEIFRIVDKVDEYLKTSDEKTVAFSSTQLIDGVASYIQEAEDIVADVERDTEEITKNIVDAINEMRTVDDIKSKKYQNFEYWVGSFLDKG